jgi:endonuclease V-like protein UPF0215 family
MIRPIEAVKNEIRILGLDTCNSHLIVGVTVRGGLYFDGVISFPSDRIDASRKYARRITESAFFPELRAIMIHNPNGAIDSLSVEKITRLPTIAVSNREPDQGGGYKIVEGNLGRLWIKTRLQSATLKKILAVAWTTGNLPEPLRVAHLLGKLEIPERSLWDKE